MEDNYCVFVNTTDRFEDCWLPFFKLFSVYWPDFKGKIYLNTEYKEFQFPGLDIVSLQNCLITNDADKITWSECLIRGLNKVNNNIVLYMQEDYFFNRSVNNEVIENYSKFLITNNIDCLHLTTASGGAPYTDTAYPDLKSVGRLANYRISCQAALWKKEVLLSYVRSHESPWQFEKYASKRARILNHNFLAIDEKFHGGNTIIPYVLTGIIQGRWKEEVVSLFTKYHINIDFTNRGFYVENEKRSLFLRIRTRVPKLGKELLSYIDLWKLWFENALKN